MSKRYGHYHVTLVEFGGKEHNLRVEAPTRSTAAALAQKQLRRSNLDKRFIFQSSHVTEV